MQTGGLSILKLTLVCFVATLLSLVGFKTTFAADITNTWDSGNVTVTLDSEGTLTISAKPGTDGKSLGYSSVNPPWQSSKVNNIIIEDGVTELGYDFLFKMTNGKVSKLTFPDSVTKLGDFFAVGSTIFNDADIVLPKNLESSYNAFSNLNLNSLHITGDYESVRYILGNNVPSNKASVKDVYIENGVTYVSSGFLGVYTGNVNIHLPDNDIEFLNQAFNGYLSSGYGKATLMNLKNQKLKIGSDSLPKNTFTMDTLPLDNLDGIGKNIVQINSIDEANLILSKVTKIYRGTFQDTTFTGTIILPSGIKTIPDMAFYNSKITGIEIPEGVERIEESAFEKCANLTKLILPDTVKFLGDDCVAYSGLEYISFPSNSVEFGDRKDIGLQYILTEHKDKLKFNIPGNFKPINRNDFLVSSLEIFYNDVTIDGSGIWDTARLDQGILATKDGELYGLRGVNEIPNDITKVMYIGTIKREICHLYLENRYLILQVAV